MIEHYKKKPITKDDETVKEAHLCKTCLEKCKGPIPVRFCTEYKPRKRGQKRPRAIRRNIGVQE